MCLSEFDAVSRDHNFEKMPQMKVKFSQYVHLLTLVEHSH